LSTLTSLQPRPDVAVIAFGEHAIGGPDAVELSSIIRSAAAQGATTVVLDLGRVTVMNSSGLGMLVSARATAASLGAVVRLSGVPPKVMELLVMTQLASVFSVYPTVDAAVSAQ